MIAACLRRFFADRELFEWMLMGTQHQPVAQHEHLCQVDRIVELSPIPGLDGS
jgi:hypothetical protein